MFMAPTVTVQLNCEPGHLLAWNSKKKTLIKQVFSVNSGVLSNLGARGRGTLQVPAVSKRRYVPYPAKHKSPKGFGSLCPKMPCDVPAKLLSKAITVPGISDKKLWAAEGRWCFCAHPSPQEGADAWHGFPTIGGDTDERVLKALRDAGHISDRELRALRKQRSLPEEWP